jgi:hypothetical protein
MRQTSRTWSIDRQGAFAPIEVLALTVTITANIGRAKLAIASRRNRSIVPKISADPTRAVRARAAQPAQRL